MAGSSHSHHHDHDPHDWASAEYVAHWAKGQDLKGANRLRAFGRIAEFKDVQCFWQDDIGACSGLQEEMRNRCDDRVSPCCF